VVWQVKALLHAPSTPALDAQSVEDQLATRVLPKLKAQRGPNVSRGLENHLYRVEVHQVGGESQGGGKKKAPTTFKWSRENGSIVFPIVRLTGDTAIVANLGPSLRHGDWVEICDDELALREQSGTLAQVEAVDRDELKVMLKWPKDAANIPNYPPGQTHDKHPLLRRWDHAGIMPNEEWIELEDGVQIWLSAEGGYRVGDYWLIPTRMATGAGVEWPQELDGEGVPKLDTPAALPPHGPRHYYAPLFHLAADGTAKDYRRAIKHLDGVP
jgi:hypothetical protein